MVKDIFGNEITYDFFGNKIKKTRKKKAKSKKTKTSTKRTTLYAIDKDRVLRRQKGVCAGKDCAKEHGRRLPVNIRSNFDHKVPLALGGKNTVSNLQALCANCHQSKTRADRKKISEAKKNGKLPKTKKKTKKKSKKRRVNQPSIFGFRI
jgi:5-methylcytosine-specific restriction endonuclease McrA